MRFAIRWMAALLSLLPLAGCRSRTEPPTPTRAGVSVALSYPVLLIGQGSLDVRDSEEALTSIPGATTFNLHERLILDSQGRLFTVVRAQPIAGEKSVLWDMGTSRRKHFVEVVERSRPSWAEIEALVLEQVRSPQSVWAGDERAVRHVRQLRDVTGLIEASRQPSRWVE